MNSLMEILRKVLRAFPIVLEAIKKVLDIFKRTPKCECGEKCECPEGKCDCGEK